MEKIVETHELENGLRLQVVDASRAIAGDRYQVAVVLRIRVPVASYATGARLLEAATLESLTRTVGDHVVFEKKEERIFIAQTEKEAVFEAVKTSLLDSVLKYCGHPDFPVKLILKRYQEALRKQSYGY